SKRGNDPGFLNTAWTIQVLRGVALWCFALCVALLLFLAQRIDKVPQDSVYADQSLPQVIAILSFTAVIGGFQSTKMFEASRNLSLGRITTSGAAAQIAGLFCIIGWALIDRSIWSLVAGNICSALALTLFSHAWLPGTANSWAWDRSASREII